MNKYVFFIVILLSVATFLILIRRILIFPFFKNLPKVYIAIGINILLFLIISLVVHPFFKTNDDTGMWLSVMGKVLVDQPTEYIQFMNVLIGKFLKNLYIYFPNLDWYIILFYTSLFTSYTYLSYILQNKFGLSKGLIFYFICFSLLGISFLVWFQFTLIAGILSSIGLFGMLVRFNLSSVLYGGFLCILGSLIRFDMFLMVFLIMMPFLLINIKRFKEFVLPILVVVVVCISLNIFNNYLYKKEFSDFMTQNSYRGKAQEYGSIEQDSTKLNVILKDIQWSKNDYDMFKNWFFSDTTIYNTRSYMKLSSNALTYDIKKLKPVMEIFKGRDFLLFVLYFAIITLAFISQNSKKYIVLSIFIVVYMMTGIIAIAFVFKVPPYRVIMMVYLASFLNLFLLINYTKKYSVQFTPFIKSALILGLVFVSSYKIYSSLKMTEELQRWNKELEIKMKSLTSESNPTFISWGGGFPFEYISLRNNTIDLDNLDIFSLGTGQNTKLSQDFLHKRNINNIYTDILNKDVILFVEESANLDRIDMYKVYMKEHYHINPKNIKIDTVAIFFENEPITTRFALKLSRKK